MDNINLVTPNPHYGLGQHMRLQVLCFQQKYCITDINIIISLIQPCMMSSGYSMIVMHPGTVVS